MKERRYELESVTPIEIIDAPSIKGDYLMSPFVWRQYGRYRMALRIVQRSDETPLGVSYVCFAEGDGETFKLADFPALRPGPGPEDRDGCEDPTMFFHGELCKVYYTGWNGEEQRSKLLFASGTDISNLEKQGDVLHADHHWNTKEATIVHTSDGSWRLFYEYSEEVHSLIGVANSLDPHGPWVHEEDPFGLREGLWDCWHISTGPIALDHTDSPVMFYNGADADARWRIGWIEFDKNCSQVTRRCEEALIRPEHLPSNTPDIAFAASSLPLDNQRLEIYFSISDRRLAKAVVSIVN